MKKDKEWLREKVSEIVEFDLDHRFGAMSDKYVPLYELCNLIDQLDEPGITDPTISKKETVEIPQFVADFIKSNKRRENGLWSVISRINKISDSPLSSNELEIIEWVYGSNVKADKMYARQEIIALAWLDGYTIEPQKKYKVKVSGELYFVRYDELEVVVIRDSAPGFIERAKLFDNKEEAEKVAGDVNGYVEELPEDEAMKLIEGWKGNE